MSNDPLAIDRLEDLLIDNPDKATQKELLETLLDETFQHKLNARAEQIRFNSNVYHERPANHVRGVLDPDHSTSSTHGSRPTAHNVSQSLFFATESRLVFNYSDLSALDTELSEWFASGDFKLLSSLLEIASRFENKYSQSDVCLKGLADNIVALNGLLLYSKGAETPLEEIMYFSFGQYRSHGLKKDQVDAIKANTAWLVDNGAYIPLLSLFVKFSTSFLGGKDAASLLTQNCTRNYLMMLTILYFMLTCTISEQHIAQSFLHTLEEFDILTVVLRLIEDWKWNPTPTTRPRQLILLLWKLLLFELGGTKQAQECDAFLIKSHHVNNKPGIDLANGALTCSPVSYLAFKEDMKDKYPLLELDDTQIQQKTDAFSKRKEVADKRHELFMALNTYSASISNSIESPCTYKSHTVFGQLPAQTIHIATPVPSPTLIASDYMLGGEKVRRSYQVNQSMPFIYPHHEKDQESIPAAIKEANDIMTSSIYESYSAQRIWKERQNFMRQERGYSGGKDTESDITDEQLPLHGDESKQHIRALKRVEKLYSKNLSRLSSLVQVLMGVIESNRLDMNLNFAEWELNPETLYLGRSQDMGVTTQEVLEDSISIVRAKLMQNLEAQRLRETTAKATSAIICLLLKWFKLSHILKQHYFSALLHDLDFLTISLDYLGRAFYNSDLQAMSRTGEAKVQGKEYEQVVSQNQLINPSIELPELDFFNMCQNKRNEPHRYCFINKELLPSIKPIIEDNNVCSASISSFNHNFAFILANILEATNKVLLKYSLQRILAMSELKPTELYKMILTNYDNTHFSTPMLKIIKKLVPYQGRKWKSINMDLISQVYLKVKLSMRDNWLSGKDLEGEYNNSYQQELALRALLQFYNRRYPDQMEAMGYDSNPDVSYLTLNEANNDPAQ